MRPPHTVRIRAGIASALLPAALAGALVFAQQPPAGAPPAPTDLEEKVTVRLAEVQILVTDRDGNPITDLEPSEVEVREEGKTRKIAYLEPFSTQGSLAKGLPQPTPVAAPGEKAPPAPEVPVAIPVPAPQRWIVVLFDVLNSRTTDRKYWVAAARKWVQSELREDDRVALMVLQSEGTVRELVPFTGDRELLASALANDAMLEGYPHQDFTLDMRRIVDDLTATCGNAYSPENCSTGLTEPYVYEWKGRGEQTLAGLQRLAGSLGAIPGRKVVLFMGPGIVTDPRLTAANAAISVFGTDRLGLSWALGQRDGGLVQALLEMTSVAAEADVSFFTFDTRPSALRDAAFTAEQADGLHERRLIDPFAQIFDTTRGALDTVAIRTGGRSMHGTSIDEHLATAARAIEGIYSLGFYRDPSAGRMPSVKVKVQRRGTQVTFPDRYDSSRGAPMTIPVEIAVGKTQGLAGGILVPVVVQARASQLSFKEEDGQDVARVSVYAEAITPAGKREASTYQQVEVRVDPSRRADRARMTFAHDVTMVLPPGPYRIRVRLSEVSFEHASDRAIDITLAPDGTVTPGIQNSVQIQETGRPKPAETTAHPSS